MCEKPHSCTDWLAADDFHSSAAQPPESNLALANALYLVHAVRYGIAMNVLNVFVIICYSLVSF